MKGEACWTWKEKENMALNKANHFFIQTRAILASHASHSQSLSSYHYPLIFSFFHNKLFHSKLFMSLIIDTRDHRLEKANFVIWRKQLHKFKKANISKKNSHSRDKFQPFGSLPCGASCFMFPFFHTLSSTCPNTSSFFSLELYIYTSLFLLHIFTIFHHQNAFLISSPIIYQSHISFFFISYQNESVNIPFFFLSLFISKILIQHYFISIIKLCV